MIVDCAHYRDGLRQHAGQMSPEDAAAICERDPGFVWLGLFEPSAEELAHVQQVFGLHELAVEDAQNFHMRPEVRGLRRGRLVRRAAHRALRRRDARRSTSARSRSSSGPSFVIPSARASASELHGRAQAPRAAPGAAPGGPAGRAVGDPRQGRRRLRAGGRGPRARHRGGRADGVLRRGRAHPAHLLPAPRGHRLLPRGAPAARPAGRGRARQPARDQPRPAPVLPRRQRPPQAGQRGGRRPARPARHGAARPTSR